VAAWAAATTAAQPAAPAALASNAGGAYFMSPQMQFASVYGWSAALPQAGNALPENPVGSVLDAAEHTRLGEGARFREALTNPPGKTLTTTTVKREPAPGGRKMETTTTVTQHIVKKPAAPAAPAPEKKKKKAKPAAGKNIVVHIHFDKKKMDKIKPGALEAIEAAQADADVPPAALTHMKKKSQKRRRRARRSRRARGGQGLTGDPIEAVVSTQFSTKTRKRKPAPKKAKKAAKKPKAKKAAAKAPAAQAAAVPKRAKRRRGAAKKPKTVVKVVQVKVPYPVPVFKKKRTKCRRCCTRKRRSCCKRCSRMKL